MIAGRFDDLRTGASWQFGPPQRILTTHAADQVIDILAEVDRVTREGAWAYGFVSYEALPGDPSTSSGDVEGSSSGDVDGNPSTSSGDVKGSSSGDVGPSKGSGDEVPLVWFAVTGPPETGTAPVAATKPYQLSEWEWDWTPQEHAGRVGRIKQAISAGETYQCNLTTRLRASFDGDPTSWYADLAARQHGGFHALVDTGAHTIVSASPECFLQWQQDRITVVPMKGTAPRGRDRAEDEHHRQRLMGSAKERAENVMIVDLVRNDLSRIATPGSVRVDELLHTERYDTLWQLTSTVSAEIAADTTIPEVFSALFPCGSITGAPKRRTMDLIEQLEDTPRGVYCGAIGWVAPPESPTRARFGIAIRTATINSRTGAVTYGVGSGIVWDSNPDAEWQELHTKALVVTDPPEPDDDLVLIETMAVRDHQILGLQRHLARLQRSADWFGIAVPSEDVAQAVDQARPGPDRILRLGLHHDGRLEVSERPLPEPGDAPVRLAVDTKASEDSTWRRHKTSRRQFCDAARQRHGEVDDVILVTATGRVTETTIASLAVQLDGQWCTPPVSDGLLPGIGREIALADGRLVERSITVDDLQRATGIAVVSSVRGWRPAVIVASPGGLS